MAEKSKETATEKKEVKTEVKPQATKETKAADKKAEMKAAKETKAAEKKAVIKAAKETKAAEKKAAKESKKAKKAEPVKEEDRVYHVSRRRLDHMWQVKAEGSSRSLKKFFTQEEAVEYAKKVADNNEGRIVIHKVDGSFKKLKY